MKRLIVLAIILALCFSVLVSCSSKEEEYTLSLGVKASVSGAKVTETVASVLTDKDGKIVQCRIDVIELSAKVDNRGDAVISKPISKRELGDSYGMSKYAEKGEWYTQAEHFERYVVGKTLEEIKNMPIEAGYPTDADLLAGCTIAVSDFQTAVIKALEGNNKCTFRAKGDVTSSVATIGSITATTATREDGSEDKTKITFSFQTDFATVVSAEKRIAGASIDSIEVKLECGVVDVEGEETTKALNVLSSTNRGTKFELGDNYGMAVYDPNNTAGEWYVQAIACAEGAIGYETKKLSVYLEDNVAGCTMETSGYKAALVKAADTVR